MADPTARPGVAPRPQLGLNWQAILWRTWIEVSRDRVLSIAGGVTFFSLLALVPALSAFVSLYGLFTDPVEAERHVATFAGLLPADAQALIADQIRRLTATAGEALTLASVFGLAFALWSAMGGLKALIEALNIAHDAVETRGFLRRQATALGLTLGSIALALAVIATTALVPTALKAVSLGPATEAVLRVIRWPALAAVVLTGLAALYRWGPDLPDARWRWITPGAVLATAGLIGFSALFSWYLANLADYDAAYGSLGAVIGLLMWMWLSVVIVLLGAELNAEVDLAAAKAKGPHLPARPPI